MPFAKAALRTSLLATAMISTLAKDFVAMILLGLRG